MPHPPELAHPFSRASRHRGPFPSCRCRVHPALRDLPASRSCSERASVARWTVTGRTALVALLGFPSWSTASVARRSPAGRPRSVRAAHVTLQLRGGCRASSSGCRHRRPRGERAFPLRPRTLRCRGSAWAPACRPHRPPRVRRLAAQPADPDHPVPGDFTTTLAGVASVDAFDAYVASCLSFPALCVQPDRETRSSPPEALAPGSTQHLYRGMAQRPEDRRPMRSASRCPARTLRRRRTGLRGGCGPLLPEGPKGARWMPRPRAGVACRGTSGAVAGRGLPRR